MFASCAPPPNKTLHPSQAPSSPSLSLSLYFFFLLISLLISSTMALFSSCAPTTFFTLSSSKPSPSHKPHLTLKKPPPLFVTRSSPENGATAVGSAGSPATAASAAAAAVVEETKKEPLGLKSEEENKEEESLDTNEVALKAEAVPAFKDPRWVSGTWNLKQFDKNGMTDWDALIDAEARRRKWLEDNPESSSNDEPVIFDTSTIPWWAWMKRFHLPEAELLNGRAAMIGFFMAYFVDSLTGMGLVDQTGNFFCKTLLFVAVSGVLFIRKNEDIEKLKKLYEETTFYDKQWQATWQDDTSNDAKSK